MDIFRNCRIIKLEVKGDERGSLVAIEGGVNIPAEIARVYYLFETKKGVSRGFHAHKELNQWVICLNGQCKMIIDNGYERREVVLSRPDEALYLGSMIWREMHDFSEDCVLMVIADKHYDEGDYIREYDKFLSLVGGRDQ